MLDIIKEGRIFDIGYYYCGGTLGSAGKELATNPAYSDHNFTTFYAANESAVKTNIEKILEEYGK